jgi:hypothetical protein
MVSLLRSGEYSTAELGDLFGVGRSTVYRAAARTNNREQVDQPNTRPRPACRPVVNAGSQLSTATHSGRPRAGSGR